MFKNKKRVIIIAAAIVALVVLFFVLRGGSKKAVATIPVTRGDITEVVSVTGNTTPLQSVSLGFQNTGTIAEVNAAVGDSVYAGELLAEESTQDLAAQRAQAQATLQTQQAKLEALKAGSTPQDIATSQTAVTVAQQSLSNVYATVGDVSRDSYLKGVDSVRTQLNALFANAEFSNASLTYSTTDSQSATLATHNRPITGAMLDAWQKEESNVDSLNAPTDLEAAINTNLAHLATIRALLAEVSKTLDNATGDVGATTIAAYKTSVGTANSEINTATKNLNTLLQNIASAKVSVTQAQSELALKQSGTRPEDIDAQAAQVAVAQASIQSINAKIANSEIISPISGVITQFDAKVGQIGTPGVSLISIISKSGFEVDVEVPETDIGKVAVDNAVDMTFDAFPNESFTGKVFYVDPAETIDQGAVNYKVKISFDKPDPRMKSGLTSNITIETKTDKNVLIVPQYALVQNDSGTFVQKVTNGVATNTPVTIGIQDQSGNAEVLSGVNEGDQILNVGLKQ